jgi:hypothetical protein
VIFDNGKTNNLGKKQYLGYMRNKDLIAYTQKALAQYMYNRYHIQKQAWPDFSKNKAWDTIKLLREDNNIRQKLNEKT